MAQITNTSNSADSTPVTLSTTPSDDEDDINEHHQFLSPSSEFYSPRSSNGVVPPHTVVKIINNDNDSANLDGISFGIEPTLLTTTTPQLDTYLNSNAASSESSLARPLLVDEHQTLPVYTSPSNNEDERIASSISSTISSTSSTVPNSRSYLTLYLTDMLISAFIITPFVNIHWRGAWDLLDIHLLFDQPFYSALISLGIGYLMLYIMYLIQGYLQSFYEKNRHNITGQIMTRVYTLILALAYIQQWRGLWNLLDLTSNVWYHLLAETGVSIVFLFLMKSIFNLNSAPFLIGIDTESYFLLDSKYTVTTKRFWQYTFDYFYYEIVEAPLLVIAWHGLYNISDLFIYPDNKQLSLIVSFTSGYLVYFILALIQIPVARCMLKIGSRTIHSFVTNIFHLIAFAGVVQIWRSLWLICEQYLNIANYHNTTLWLCYGVSFLVLTFGLAAGSLNGPGGSKDSYVDEGPILLFKFDYFSSLLRQQHTDETIPSQTSSQSGILLWIIVNVLRRHQRRNTLSNRSRSSTLVGGSRRNTLMAGSRRNSLTDADAPPTISETLRIN